MTKFQLMQMLFASNSQQTFGVFGRGAKDRGDQLYTGVLQSVEREDGSGRSFNVRMVVNRRPVIVHVRTND
jgi:hypothetical protein